MSLDPVEFLEVKPRLCQERLDPYMWVSSNGLPMSLGS